MLRLRRACRDGVVGVLLAAGLVALVFGQGLLGGALLLVGLWQVVVIARGRGGMFVDQREADKPGKPILK